MDASAGRWAEGPVPVAEAVSGPVDPEVAEEWHVVYRRETPGGMLWVMPVFALNADRAVEALRAVETMLLGNRAPSIIGVVRPGGVR